eukprot:TRINITY_DN4345_c0_g1_i1.p1 TRINITY_DN4345_c0_g1~~TRINITY_DN4345_c0_g1_i1.p1  ORF type:complete len:279 (-),score=105.42 TRINITY_DN4345_c0_g1_i1:26-862(-)
MENSEGEMEIVKEKQEENTKEVEINNDSVGVKRKREEEDPNKVPEDEEGVDGPPKKKKALICGRCNKEKPLKQYSNRQRLKKPHLRNCKECVKKREIAYQADRTYRDDKEIQKEKNENQHTKRKCAILFGYNGTNYHGLQINNDVITIEHKLHEAIVKAGGIAGYNIAALNKVGWQRCGRTDKGVHAIGQIVSCKLQLYDELAEEINKYLPQDIRAFKIARVTKGFNSKNHCDFRTYEFNLPTYCFMDSEEFDRDRSNDEEGNKDNSDNMEFENVSND